MFLRLVFERLCFDGCLGDRVFVDDLAILFLSKWFGDRL